MTYFSVMASGIDTSALKDAGVNTLVGMVTVFIILIFISLIISCFSIIPKIQASFAKKKENNAALTEGIDNAVEQIISAEEATPQEDDLELVAVITAAIMEYLGDEAPSDGLVVRNIRRRR